MKLEKLIFKSFLLLMIADGLQYLSSPVRFNFNGTIIIGILKFVSFLIILYLSRKVQWKKEIPTWIYNIIRVLIVWNVFTILHGFLSSKSYWDWKFIVLSNWMSLLMPYVAIVGLAFFYQIKLTKFIISYLLFYCLFLLPFHSGIFGTELFPRMATGIIFLLLISPYFDYKWRIRIYFVGILSILFSLGYRANVLRVLIAGLIPLLFYFRFLLNLKILGCICTILFALPFVLLFTGITGTFNIFQPFAEDDSVISISQNGDQVNLVADTRTFLYVEVLTSMSNNNTLIYGEGAAGKYVSTWFNDLERYGAEVGFLNILLYSGIVGVLLYFLAIGSACYLAIFYSNNFLAKIFALFLSFRWILLFIEDMPQYEMNYFFLWIIIGLCYSNSFRKLNDKQISSYLKRVMLKPKFSISNA